MLTSRIITALVLVPIVIAALFLLSPTGFALVSLIVCMLAAWEWGQLAGFTSRSQRTSGALLCGLFLSIMWLGFPGVNYNVHWPIIMGALWTSVAWWVIALFLVFCYPRSATWWRHSRLLKILFGAFTIIPFFWGVMVLRHYGYETDRYRGAWWLLYVMLLVWGADSGGYVFGKLFGKNKLAPKVSPGKTWEGFIGGLITAILISWGFGTYAPLTEVPLTLLTCSVIVVLASVLGDLTESMFKREAGIKDSGHLIPGHGGVLDRIDSLTAAVPIFACLMLLMFY